MDDDNIPRILLMMSGHHVIMTSIGLSAHSCFAKHPNFSSFCKEQFHCRHLSTVRVNCKLLKVQQANDPRQEELKWELLQVAGIGASNVTYYDGFSIRVRWVRTVNCGHTRCASFRSCTEVIQLRSMRSTPSTSMERIPLFALDWSVNKTRQLLNGVSIQRLCQLNHRRTASSFFHSGLHTPYPFDLTTRRKGISSSTIEICIQQDWWQAWCSCLH